jgi:hypothetical protein
LVKVLVWRLGLSLAGVAVLAAIIWAGDDWVGRGVATCMAVWESRWPVLTWMLKFVLAFGCV